ncbi:MAG: response regulator [Bacteroidetes bacterium]|nr:response regulator [Bacteroidota bacterium]
MKRKVLIVEDHEGFRKLLGNFLSKNYEVVSARNGLEAMTLLNKGVIPDVIVSDTRMPELNGAQLLYHLRCSGMFGKIPVLIISEQGKAEEEAFFKSLGAQDYLSKPFNPVSLQDALGKMPFA